jgi:endonuclease-3 related protein
MSKTLETPLSIYRRLYKAYGAQQWWPAESPFEVMVGAILTQNTAWQNVEKAILNLKKEKVLSAKALHNLSHSKLADLIRPSGYFNIKANRLKHFCDWYLKEGELKRLQKRTTEELRKALLSVNGIGPETADDILLYAFHRPVFVIDTYTRRLFQRLDFIKGDEPYEALRSWLEESLGLKSLLFNEYHALIVQHAKVACRKKPLCQNCVLKNKCTTSLLAST